MKVNAIVLWLFRHETRPIFALRLLYENVEQRQATMVKRRYNNSHECMITWRVTVGKFEYETCVKW